MKYSIALKIFELLVFFGAGFLIEVWTAADEGNTAKNVRFNVSYTLLRSLFDIALGGSVAWWLFKFINGFGLNPLFSFHSDIPGIAASIGVALIALLVRDFFYYWFHRLQHSSKWLWAEHELHHSDEHVNVTTAQRHHWLETPLEAILVVLPAGLLFESPAPTIAAYFFTQATGYFIHMNSRIRLGAFFGSPALHRVHHSKSPEHIDKNFAAHFPLWDILFGTYCPAPKLAPETGLASGETVYSIPYALAMPFIKWAKMLRDKTATKSLVSNSQV